MKLEFGEGLINVCIITIVALALLKWLGVITVSWWLVFMPIWILLFLLDVLVVLYIGYLKGMKTLYVMLDNADYWKALLDEKIERIKNELRKD